MAIAETARLITELQLRDQLTPGLARAKGELSQASAATTGLHGGLSRLGGVTSTLGGAFATMRGRLSAVGQGISQIAGVGGILGLGFALQSSIGKARDFAQAMELIHTQAGGTQAEVVNMSKALLGLAGQVGTGPEALAAGLYHIESAGLRGAKALEILKVAAEGARVGNADLESVTNALIASVNSGIKGTTNMSQAMGVLNAVVGAGNMRMQDLTDAFSTGILASARAFGISIQSVGSAIADMTNQGVPAIDAATRLRMTISLLGAPTSKAATEFKRIGLGALDLATTMRGPGGILAAVQQLRDHLDKSGLSATQTTALISHAFGGGRSSSAILTLLSSLTKFKSIQDQVNAGTNKFLEAWDATTHTAAFKIENFGAIVEATQIKIGNKILPLLADALGGLGNWFSTHGNDIANFFGGVVSFAKSAAGAVGTLVGAFNRLPSWAKELLIGGAAEHITARFLLGFDPLAIGVKMAIGFAGRALIGGVGGLIGKLIGSKAIPQLIVGTMAGAVPVFVTNPGFGKLPGGGLPIAPLEQAGGGLLATFLASGALPLTALAVAVAAAAALIITHPGHDPSAVHPGLDERTGRRVGGFDRTAAYGLRGSTASNPLHVTDAQLGHQAAANQRATDALTKLGTSAKAREAGPLPGLTWQQFMSDLKRTSFIGPAQYKSLFERFSTFRGARGADPTGAGFLELVKRLENPKAPQVMFEIRGHLKELRNLEAFYIAHGDTINAIKVQGVINEVDKLIGITVRDNSATLAAHRAVGAEVRKNHLISSAGFRALQAETSRVAPLVSRAVGQTTAVVGRWGGKLDRLNALSGATAGNTGIIARKRTNITVNVPVTVPVTVSLSVSAIQQQIVRLETANASRLTRLGVF